MGRQILIVDDEPGYAQTLCERLELRGYAARACTDPAEALALFRKKPVAVVLLDLWMPGMDGIEVLRLIKRIRPITEVILLTGYAAPDSAVEAAQLGIFEYLTKHSSFESLIGKIDAAMARFDMHQDRIEKARRAAQKSEPAVDEDPW
jgi:DNA-binding NtrC family response regulator